MQHSTRHGSCGLLASAILLFACTAPPENAKSNASPAPKSSATPSATSGTTVSALPASASGQYDPKKDPLVNPKEMFEPVPADLAQVASEDTLILHLDGSPTNLNPIFSSAGIDDYAQSPMYDQPFLFDKEMKWFVNKEVVESYQEAADHLSATVKMKSGLKWQDGQPWTAEDIRFSWQAILDPQVPCPAVKVGTDQIDDVQVIDPLTVKFVFHEALPTNEWNMLFPIIPKHIFDNADERKKDPTLQNSPYFNAFNRDKVVGNGPYKLVEWVPNDKLVYELWDDYPGKKPHFKRLILLVQPDSNVSLLSFKKGDVDVIDKLTAKQFANETNDAEFAAHGHKVHRVQWTSSHIGWNMDGSNPFFKDKQVRTAMSYAMNVPWIIEKLGYNLPTPSAGIFHPDSWMYNPEIKPIVYDLKKAADLLDEAGWKVGADDGIRYKEVNGSPVKFDFEMIIPQGSEIGINIAANFASDLKKIGVILRTRIIEWTVFQKMTLQHEFQAEISSWGTGTDPDTDWNLWRTEQYKEGRNYGGYSNARVDDLFVQGRREFDPAKRKAVYQEIDKIIYDDQPYTFLIYAPVLSAVEKRIRGVQVSPRGIYNFDPSWYAWWVPKGQALRAQRP